MGYRGMREPQEELRARIKELAAERPRWGYRRIHLLLRREGWAVNRKRVERGPPDILITDNGSEFTSRAFDAWAYARGVRIRYIQPGKPVQNCYIESFNRTFRDECLNLHWFVSLADARRTIEAWRVDYNRVRPHSSLGYLTPEEFVDVQSLGGQVLANTVNPVVPQ